MSRVLRILGEPVWVDIMHFTSPSEGRPSLRVQILNSKSRRDTEMGLRRTGRFRLDGVFLQTACWEERVDGTERQTLTDKKL